MTDFTEHRTHADGSIDYAHYVARGRKLRSLALLRALRWLRPTFQRTRLLEQQADRDVRPETGRTQPAEPIEALAAE